MSINKHLTALSSDGATLAKVIATFCVVLTHSYKLFKYMEADGSEVFYLRGIHAFAACGVSVFFLLSGYFLVFKDNWDYGKNLKKKLRSLVIPYCVFTVLYASISICGALALPRFFDDFRTFTAYDWLTHLFGIPFVIAPIYYGPLWFVRELLIFNILAVVLVPVVKKIPDYIVIPAMLVIYFLPIPQIIRYSIPFFIAGMCFGFKKRIPIPKQPVWSVLMFAVGFVLPIAVSGDTFAGDLAWKISVFLMSLSVVSLSGKLAENGKINKMAKVAIPFSFPVYLLHEYPMTTVMRLLALKNIPIPLATVAFIVLPFVVIGLCVLVIIVWKRLLPKTYSFCTGGRY